MLLIRIALVADHDKHSFIDWLTETCILLSIKNYLLFSVLLLLSLRLLIYPGYEFHVWHAVIFSAMDGTREDHVEEDRLRTERQTQYGLVLVGRERVRLLGAEWRDGYQMG